MKDYNGFTGRQRQKVFEIIKHLKTTGRIIKEHKVCEICGTTEGFIGGHSENYFDWYNTHSLCSSCHINLHLRFKAWDSWIGYLIKIRNGFKPKAYNSIFNYIRSKENKEFFKSKPPQQFIPNPELWYENLKPYKINIYQQEVDAGNYPADFIETSWSAMRKEQRKLNVDKV